PRLSARSHPQQRTYRRISASAACRRRPALPLRPRPAAHLAIVAGSCPSPVARRPLPGVSSSLAASHLARMKILIIEDDPTVGQYVKRGLEEQRWGVDLVADGEEGERRAQSEAYDMVVLDMRLP